MKIIRGAFAALLLIASAAFAQMDPFNPVATTSVAVTGSAQTVTLPNAITGIRRQLVLTDSGTQVVFLVCDGTISTNPTTATTSNGMPLLSNSQLVVSVPAAVTACSVIAGSTGSTLYITVGVGQ